MPNPDVSPSTIDGLIGQDEIERVPAAEIEELPNFHDIDAGLVQRGEVEPAASGRAKQKLEVQTGISTEKARSIVKKIKEAKNKLSAEKAKTEPLQIKEYESRLAALFASLGEERIVDPADSSLGRTPSEWASRLEAAYRRSEKELDLSDYANELRAVEAELRTQDGFLDGMSRTHSRLNDDNCL